MTLYVDACIHLKKKMSLNAISYAVFISYAVLSTHILSSSKTPYPS